jgi:arylsulfatase A-like enzyme
MPPNILLMIADDHRHDCFSGLGHPEVTTPHFDALMARGTVFTRTYIMGSTSGAVCLPTRGMLLTGRGLFHAPDPLPTDIPLLPQLFRQAGYTTYHVGKWHNHAETHARSFNGGAKIFMGGMSDHDAVPVRDFDPTGAYPDDAVYTGDKFSTDLFGDAAIEFLDRHDGHKPFFMWCAFTSPHDPRTPPADHIYDPEGVTLPPNFLPEHPFDNGEMRIRDEELAPMPRTPEVIRQHIADYYGMISDMDEKVGEIMAALNRNGLMDNTIVVYLSDHGLSVGQHGLLGKQNQYDHSMRTPMMIAGPGVPVGERRDALVYSFDLFPTLCELAGIAIPHTCEGHSLFALMHGHKTAHRDTIFSAYQRSQGESRQYQRMVRDKRYKLIEYVVDDGRQTQMFDLESDPWERHNLADQHPDEVARLRALLAWWQAQTDDPNPIIA